MIEPWISVIAWQRQREWLAAAEQHRLCRRARHGKKNGRTVDTDREKHSLHRP
jgi:hypothetical protein